ncbi:MAG: SMC family ATPase [Clostridiales bacterium]|nr:SMC family ATPase [Clostridiales bacterium]
MRPILLTMTAFGSYVEETTLDFGALQKNLFLICGDTGAGKTTIFDAIMFALFGEGSGSARDAKGMHSDFADVKQDTVVLFRFAHGGAEYEVTRKLHYTRAQGWRPDAELRLPDGTFVKGARYVNERCEAMLGFNAAQFRKIVMLAQGEFQQFLKANSNDREEILGKLFDDAECRYYARLLVGARDALRETRRAHEDAARAALGDGTQFPEAWREKLIYGDPALTENLGALLAEESAAGEGLQKAYDEAQQKLGLLNAQKGAAEQVNRNLDALDAARAALAKLEAQREGFAARRTACDRVRAAWRTVRPAVIALDDAERAVREAAKRISALGAQREKDVAAIEAAKKAVEADAPNVERAEALAAQRAKLSDERPAYARLAAAEQALREAAAKLAEAEDGRRKGEEWIEKAEEKRAALTQLRETLKDAPARAVGASHACEAAGERVKALEALRLRVEEIEGKRAALAKQAARADKADEKSIAAMRYYADIHARFIAGQSGILAEELRGEVEQNGFGVCAVCGTRVGRAQIPQFAVKPPETPDKAQVERAEKAHKDADSERETIRNLLTKNTEEVNGDVAHALDDAKKLSVPAETYDALTEGGLLKGAYAEAVAARADAQKALAEAQAAAKRFEESGAELDRLERDMARGRDRLNALNDEVTMWTAEKAGREGRLKTTREGLSYAAEAELDSAIGALDAEKAALDRLIEAHKRALESAEKARVATESGLKETEAQKLRDEAKREDALNGLGDACAAAGVADRAEYEAILVPLEGEDGERFIRREEDAVNRYETDCVKAREAVAQLAAQTEGKARVDTRALEAGIAQCDEARIAANRALVDSRARQRGYAETQRRVGAALSALSDTDDAWTQLRALAAAAEGVTGESGKVSFERFVIASVFDEVLERANLRLDAISGGQYTLMRSDEARRRNAAAGLELQVMDHTTGQKRNAESLSGGESFFTSLALALGLSDVVQSRAGGMRLEALFIDEGFGSLDQDVLDRAVNVLDELTEGSRLVGIISHVDTLKESIPQKVIVSKRKGDGRGSRLRVEMG